MNVFYTHFRLEQEDWEALVAMGENGSTPRSWTRPLRRHEKRSWIPSCKGGYTVATIELSDGRRFVGEANCSLKENYNRKKGRNIALGRALKQIPENKT